MDEVFTYFKLDMHATATVLKSFEPHPSDDLYAYIFKAVNEDAKKHYGTTRYFEINEWKCLEISEELDDEKKDLYQIEFSVRGVLGCDCAYDEDRETGAMYLRDEDDIKDDIDTIWIFRGFDVEFSNIFTEVEE